MQNKVGVKFIETIKYLWSIKPDYLVIRYAFIHCFFFQNILKENNEHSKIYQENSISFDKNSTNLEIIQFLVNQFTLFAETMAKRKA